MLRENQILSPEANCGVALISLPLPRAIMGYAKEIWEQGIQKARLSKCHVSTV